MLIIEPISVINRLNLTFRFYNLRETSGAMTLRGENPTEPLRRAGKYDR